MAGHNSLHRLAELAGIETEYWDVFGGYHETTDETRRTLLAGMGFSTATDGETNDSLARIEDDPWRCPLDPVTVLRVGEHCPQPAVSITLPASDVGLALNWFLDCEDTRPLHGVVIGSELPIIESRVVNGEDYLRLHLALPHDLATGYHRLRLETPKCTATGAVIAAPPSAYRPDWLVSDQRRLWGVACQLYALRSENDWGIGDFSDLGFLCGKTAKLGGSLVGLSPLHALFPGRPERVSPYSPSSRLFLNPIYIDVTAVPEFATCDAARAHVKSSSFAAHQHAVRTGAQVAYANVTDLKMETLALLYDAFRAAHPGGCGSDRRLAFDAFVALGAEPLQRFALFEAVHEHFGGSTTKDWPQAYRAPDSDACADFARTHAARIGFFIYQQWETERQLAIVATRCAGDGMDIGLYRDLAVGVAPDGADAWTQDGAFVSGINFGAPPDPLAPSGQDWGMQPFNPIRLREMAYAPYIDMLRSNMRHAGAVRVDHAMWMQHMFWIPQGKDGRDGAYVRYPMDDLFAILALESQRNRCLVVGEDLGTVPEGFSARMEAEGILSYRLMQFQRHADGLYRRPDAYPALSLATSASHDMPTLAGFWTETDLETLADIGHIANAGDLGARRDERARDRAYLVAALIDQGFLELGFPVTVEHDNIKTLIAAVHSFLARTPAVLMMINLEDIIAATAQINVPGTIDEHPNWRHRLQVTIEQLVNDPYFTQTTRIVRDERGQPS